MGVITIPSAPGDPKERILSAKSLPSDNLTKIYSDAYKSAAMIL